MLAHVLDVLLSTHQLRCIPVFAGLVQKQKPDRQSQWNQPLRKEIQKQIVIRPGEGCGRSLILRHKGLQYPSEKTRLRHYKHASQRCTFIEKSSVVDRRSIPLPSSLTASHDLMEKVEVFKLVNRMTIYS